ncbi:MAG: UDP-3-O-acyl-N-acetylglucosamine deacetylase [bacterium]
MTTQIFQAKTLASPLCFEGIGIHSGQAVTLRCLPSEDLDLGLYVVRCDQHDHIVPVTPHNFCSTKRASELRYKGVSVYTPEHLLSACHALGISHARFELSAAEFPIMDGSAQPFFEAFEKAGVKTLASELSPISPTSPFEIRDHQARIDVSPSTSFRISYTLDYPDHFIGQQVWTGDLRADTYGREIAAARTYGFYNEVQALYDQNLAKGGSMDNAVIIGDDDYMTALRFPDELVRHKVLDLIGDLWVLQRPLQMHVRCFKSGHEANRLLVHALQKWIDSSSDS